MSNKANTKANTKELEISSLIPEGFELDCIKDGKLILKEKESWKGLGKIKGCYINASSDICITDLVVTRDNNKNIWTTREQAEACLAMSQLSQLVLKANKGWIPDWGDRSLKYVIMAGDSIYINSFHSISSFLAFKYRDVAEDFLKSNRDLINIAKVLL